MGKRVFLIIMLLLINITYLEAKESNKKRILYVSSYHSGLSWSDGIEKGIRNTIKDSKLFIDFKMINMDTKRNQSEIYKRNSALKVKKVIEEFKPDIVITSDDNAAKYLIVPYFYDSEIPFVFCGVNGSASKYGFPSKNVTGMIEVQSIAQLIAILGNYAKGGKIGYLKGDSFSSRKEIAYFESILNKKMEKKFVTTIVEWKKVFLELQKSVDILLIGNGGVLKGWDKSYKELVQFVKNNTLIPTASWDSSVKEIVMLTFANQAEEQGVWSSKTALKILQGEDISKIPLVENKEVLAYINVSLAKKLNIIFPFNFIDNAMIVE